MIVLSFFDSSRNRLGATVNGGSIFWDGSLNERATVNGGAIFHNSSKNSGATDAVVNDGATFNDTSENIGTVNDGATFNGSSKNKGIGLAVGTVKRRSGIQRQCLLRKSRWQFFCQAPALESSSLTRQTCQRATAQHLLVATILLTHADADK